MAEKAKAAAARDVDPYLLAGTFIEGVAHTVAGIPPVRQPDTARAAFDGCLDRLRAEGLF